MQIIRQSNLKWKQLQIHLVDNQIAMPIQRFEVAVYDVTMGSNHIAESYDSKHGTGTSPMGSMMYVRD